VYVCESRQGVRVYIYVRVCETGCESVYICVREKTEGGGGGRSGVFQKKKDKLDVTGVYIWRGCTRVEF